MTPGRRSDVVAGAKVPSPSERFSSTLGAAGLVACLVAGFALVPRLFPARNAPMVGRQAPDFHLDVVANGAGLGLSEPLPSSLDLRDLRGRAVVLDFWATWCPPCRAEAPIVDRVARRWRDRGVVVVGVDTDTPDQGNPHDYAVAHGLGYPIVHDPAGTVSRSYEVDVLPTLVVISRTGAVLAVRTGITEDGELERLVREAL